MDVVAVGHFRQPLLGDVVIPGNLVAPDWQQSLIGYHHPGVPGNRVIAFLNQVQVVGLHDHDVAGALKSGHGGQLGHLRQDRSGGVSDLV